MYEETLTPLNFESQSQYLLHSSISPYFQPFTIIYNARSTQSSQKPRRGSISKLSDLTPKSKKSRKMTLPSPSNNSMSILQQVMHETHSQEGMHSHFFEENISTMDKIDYTKIDEMDLQKGIQCDIVEESELDKESWFGRKYQNPEFGTE